MPLARTVESCLARQYLPYAVISHVRSLSSRETAQAATVPLSSVAKAVVLGDERGFVMAVVAGDMQVDVCALSCALNRPLEVVSETRLVGLFQDCQLGAIPPLGPAYGIETIIDERLLRQDAICFVAGDHDELVCVDREVFLRLINGARLGAIGCPSNAHPDSATSNYSA
jgi:Ala-tRNA(Pro) deacylase